MPNRTAASPSDLLTPSEAAQILRVSKRAIYELARVRKLPVIHIGRRVRVLYGDLQEYVAQGRQEGLPTSHTSSLALPGQKGTVE